MKRITPRQAATKLRGLASELEADGALAHRPSRPIMATLLSAYLAGFHHGASSINKEVKTHD